MRYNFKMTDIPLIEPTPEIKNRRCKMIAYAIKIILSYGVWIVAAVLWFKYDLFFGVAGLLITFVVLGIVRSKIRNSVIPQTQQEYQYTDLAIAQWYVAKRLCFDYDEIDL